jgi:glycerophosphoryl diester phosphodiesterase
VLGHRGARHAAPENTLLAFEKAFRERADGFELDVRLDGSGAVIVLHDVTLERVTRKRDRRPAEALTTAELSRIDVGGGERVPTLASVLAFARAHDLRVNIELKHDVSSPATLIRGVVALVRDFPDAPERLILSCFHPLVVYRLARELSHVPIAWLVHAKQRVLRFAPGWRRLGAVAVHPEHPLLTPLRMARLRAAGAVVNTWTVNDPERARVLADLGVDAIISDNPGAILQALGGT